MHICNPLARVLHVHLKCIHQPVGSRELLLCYPHPQGACQWAQIDSIPSPPAGEGLRSSVINWRLLKSGSCQKTACCHRWGWQVVSSIVEGCIFGFIWLSRRKMPTCWDQPWLFLTAAVAAPLGPNPSAGAVAVKNHSATCGSGRSQETCLLCPCQPYRCWGSCLRKCVLWQLAVAGLAVREPAILLPFLFWMGKVGGVAQRRESRALECWRSETPCPTCTGTCSTFPVTKCAIEKFLFKMGTFL